MLKRLLTIFSSSSSTDSPVTLSAEDHQLNLQLISANALTVVDTLQQAGYQAYIVGGGVRDLLLDGTPKDFDVATDATPEQTKALFRNALLIGKRFRIVHVRFGREIIEVTTFRGHHDDAKNTKEASQAESGILLRDNVYGDVVSDALRRDFTINALYFDPAEQEVLDFSTGLADLETRTLKMIGEPEKRYREDPVRMLRAVRFAAKLQFTMDKATEAPIKPLGQLLNNVPPARRFEEVLKLFLGGNAKDTLVLLREYNLLGTLFPGTDYCLAHASEQEQKLVVQVAINTDARIRQKKRITPAFIYAVFLWLPLQAAIRKLREDDPKIPMTQAIQVASQGVISQQLAATAIPKRFLIPMRDIWHLQVRLEKRDNKRAYALLEHQRFRAAYDFLLLREQAGEELGGLGQWWTKFQSANGDQQQALIRAANEGKPKRRRSRRRRPSSANQDSDNGNPRPQ